MPLKHPACVRVASLCLLCSPCLYFSTRGLAFLTEGLLISRRDVDVCGEVGGEVKLGGELTVRDGDMGPMELYVDRDGEACVAAVPTPKGSHLLQESAGSVCDSVLVRVIVGILIWFTLQAKGPP